MPRLTSWLVTYQLRNHNENNTTKVIFFFVAYSIYSENYFSEKNLNSKRKRR